MTSFMNAKQKRTMSDEIKEKEEYEKYARDHRKELDAQEVRLGDIVTVLVGHFAGEKGVIVGIIACDKSDYADPYYEIEMECDVPEEFRVRKTLIGRSRVIGGVEKRYLKVIGNRAPKQPSMEIKQGDKVRVSKDVPKLIFGSCDMSQIVYTVCCVDKDVAAINVINDERTEMKVWIVPTKYLVKVDAKAKEAKYKVGNWVMISGVFNPQLNGMIGWISRIDKDGNKVSFQDGRFAIVEDKYLTLITQPTEHTEAKKKPYEGISEETANEISDMLEAYAKTLSGIADSFDWQRYEADLAKEVALKVANKFNDPKEAAEYAVKVAKAVVEGLKNK